MENNKLTKTVVEDYLLEQGFKVGQLGFRDTVDAILIWEDHFHLRKDVLNIIAQQKSVPVQTVERNVRHSIKTSNLDPISAKEFIAYTKLILSRRYE